MSTTSQATPTAAETLDGVATRDRGGQRRSQFIERYGLLLLLVAVSAFFSFSGLTRDIFPTRLNVLTILSSQSVVLVTALAGLTPLLAGRFDLSIGAMTGMASIACAATMSTHGAPLTLAVVVAIGLGALLGAANGFLIARLGLNHFIVTLGTLTVLEGVMQWYTGGAPITTGLARSLQDFGSLRWLGLPRPVYVLVPLVLAAYYVSEHTPFGRRLHAIGSNPQAARLVGIRVERHVWATYVLSGALCGVAGVMLTARSGGADPQAGPSLLFPALAAVLLGATAIRPGRPNVLGTVVGVFFVAVSVSGLSIAGADAWVRPAFNGTVLLVAVAMTRRATGAGEAAGHGGAR